VNKEQIAEEMGNLCFVSVDDSAVYVGVVLGDSVGEEGRNESCVRVLVFGASFSYPPDGSDVMLGYKHIPYEFPTILNIPCPRVVPFVGFDRVLKYLEFTSDATWKQIGGITWVSLLGRLFGPKNHQAILYLTVPYLLVGMREWPGDVGEKIKSLTGCRLSEGDIIAIAVVLRNECPSVFPMPPERTQDGNSNCYCVVEMGDDGRLHVREEYVSD
jgi:hypothetical protein